MTAPIGNIFTASILAVILAAPAAAQGDPLQDIKAARNVKFVIKAGSVYDPVSLLKSAEGKIGPSGPDDHAAWELTIEPLRKN